MDTSRNSRIPLGEDESKVSRCVLFSTNSAMNLSRAVVTSGVSAGRSRAGRSRAGARGRAVSYLPMHAQVAPRCPIIADAAAQCMQRERGCRA